MFVQLDTRDGVFPAFLPVATFEAARSAARQLTEVVVVLEESIDEDLRDPSSVVGCMRRVLHWTSLHVCNQGVAEFAALDLGGIVHQACKVVGDCLLADRRIHTADDDCVVTEILTGRFQLVGKIGFEEESVPNIS